MKLLIVRHGQTDLNKAHKTQGLLDYSLNESGRAQAEALAESLANTHIDVVISSPLKRAYETALAICKGREIAIIRDERAREMDFGDWEGTDWRDSGACNVMFYSKNTRTPNGETTHQFAQRVKDFIDEIVARYRNTDKTILIVAHGVFTRAVDWAINGVQFDENGDEISTLVENGTVQEYLFS